MSTKTEGEIRKYRELFPEFVRVKVERSKDGGFLANIVTYDGCFTEADTFSELIEMVNDAVKTYLEIPEKYLSFMPTYLPTIEQAQELDAFPTVTVDKEVNLEFSRLRETNKC